MFRYFLVAFQAVTGVACLKDFNSIENLLMHTAWLQLSIELGIFLTKRMECCEMHMFGLPR